VRPAAANRAVAAVTLAIMEHTMPRGAVLAREFYGRVKAWGAPGRVHSRLRAAGAFPSATGRRRRPREGRPQVGPVAAADPGEILTAFAAPRKPGPRLISVDPYKLRFVFMAPARKVN